MGAAELVEPPVQATQVAPVVPAAATLMYWPTTHLEQTLASRPDFVFVVNPGVSVVALVRHRVHVPPSAAAVVSPQAP